MKVREARNESGRSSSSSRDPSCASSSSSTSSSSSLTRAGSNKSKSTVAPVAAATVVGVRGTSVQGSCPTVVGAGIPPGHEVCHSICGTTFKVSP